MDRNYEIYPFPAELIVHRPRYEALPGDMTSNEVFSSLGNGRARYPCITESHWESLKLEAVPAAIVLDIDGPPLNHEIQ